MRGQMGREIKEGEMRARFLRRCTRLGKVKGFALMFSLIWLVAVGDKTFEARRQAINT